MNQDSRDAMDDIKKFRHKTFEELRHETEDGGEYWSARELYPVLEYSRWEKFEQVIERAILSCDISGHRSEAHFHRAVKMGHIGLGKQKETSDYHISRHVGMTRRLDPQDRIDELGDASLPFQFDVHAMIYHENAPELEHKLHQHFEKFRMNKINPRKEFFKVSLDEIERVARQYKGDVTVTRIAEAKEYRQTLAMEKEMQRSA